ncbi:MAG: phage major capsid protein [Cyanobacteria bacterium P01_F01_bin.143]
MDDVLIRSQGDLFQIGDHKIPSFQRRDLQISDIEEKEEGVIEFSLTSEQPYRRFFGMEILSHEQGAVNLERVNSGSAPLLLNHDPNQYLGSLLSGRLADKKVRVTAKFELDNPYNELAKRYYHSVTKGNLRTVSGGYAYEKIKLETREQERYLIAVRWGLVEGSICPAPADHTVGVGRSYFDLTTRIEHSANNGESSGQLENTNNDAMPTELEVNETDLLKAERERTRSILAAGQRYGCQELAEKAVQDGLTIEQARSLFLDKINDGKPQPIARTTDPLGMSRSERKRYSINNAIRAALDGEWKENSFEKEIHDALVTKAKETRNYKETGNILIPAYDLDVSPEDAADGFDQMSRSASTRNYLQKVMQRDQMVGDPLFGGNLVETELMSERFIDIFRNRSIMRQMGMTSLTGLVGNVDIPKQTAGVTDGTSIYWVPEDADVGKISAQFGLVKLRPKNAGSYMYVTRSMLLQSSIGMDNFVRRELAIALALGMDRAAIEGTGLNDEPLGIINTPGVNPIIFGENGDVATHPKLVSFETKIAVANADERTMGWVMNAKTRGELKSREKFPGTTGQTLWQEARLGSNQGYVNGYRVGVSNQIPGNLVKGTGTGLSAVVFGDFSRLICGEWGTYELAADPYHKFLAGGVRVRIIHTCDIQVTQEKAFSVGTDLATPYSNEEEDLGAIIS